jgi:hypothetical protein
MTLLKDKVAAWLQTADEKLADGGIQAADLAELRQALTTVQPRQRLLYLHVREPLVYSQVIGMAEHGPVPEGRDRLRTREDWPYNSVHDAICDGWFVVRFPEIRVQFDDFEVDYLGFEFVLQKVEETSS